MKQSFIFKYLLYSLVLLTAAVPAFADVKIKSKQTVSGQSYENATYIKGKRQRTESMGGMSINIMQCDLKRNIDIMPQAQAYTIKPFADPNSAEPKTETVVDQKTTTTVTKGGTITTTITTKDTGERKQMFGYTAKHIITTIESVSSPDACDPVNTKMQQDGWYIDATFALSCSQNSYQNYTPTPKAGGCHDKTQVKQIGAPKTGFALLEKMTMYDASGKETFSTLNEVVELSNATLNDSLFDVPAGYQEFKDSNQMYAAMAKKASANGAVNGNSMPGASNMPGMNTGAGANFGGESSGMNASVKNLGNKTSSASTEVGAKKAGVVRIGLANVKTGTVGEGMNPAELATAIGNTLADYLKTPQVEVVQLSSRLASQADLEAKDKQCDYVVYATVSHKKGGGGGFGKMFGAVAPMMGNMIPMAGGVGGAIAGSVATTAVISAASMTGSVKSKDELTLEYKLIAPGSQTPTLANTVKGKAKSDGEDIISPLIEQAAQAIVNAVAK